MQITFFFKLIEYFFSVQGVLSSILFISVLIGILFLSRLFTLWFLKIEYRIQQTDSLLAAQKRTNTLLKQQLELWTEMVKGTTKHPERTVHIDDLEQLNIK